MPSSAATTGVPSGMRKSHAQVSLPTWLPMLWTWLTGNDIPHPNGIPTSGVGIGTAALAGVDGRSVFPVSARTGPARSESARRIEDAELSTGYSVQYLTCPMWVHHRLRMDARLLRADGLRTTGSDRRLTFRGTRLTSERGDPLKFSMGPEDSGDDGTRGERACL